MKLLSLLIKNIGKATANESGDTAVQPSDISGLFTFRRDFSNFSTSFGYHAVNKTKVVNNKLFVLGSQGALLVSEDGENFTKLIGLNDAGWLTSKINDIDYNPVTGLYVVVGESGYAAKSSDLTSWELLPAINTTSLGNGNWIGVFSFPERWLIVGAGHQFVLSFDGNNSFATFGTQLTIVPGWGNRGGGAIASHRIHTGTQIRIICSYTVAVVTAATGVTGVGDLASTIRPLSIGSGENGTNNFVCFGNTSMYSIAGSFQYTPIARTAEDKYMNFSGGKFFICRTDGTFRRSSNFSSVDLTVSLTNTQFGIREVNSVQFFNGKWRVFGPGVVISSLDLSTWESLIDFSGMLDSFSMTKVNQLYVDGDKIFAVGDRMAISSSADAVDWNFSISARDASEQVANSQYIKNNNILRMTKNGNDIVLQLNSGYHLRSTDNGESWEMNGVVRGFIGVNQLLTKMDTRLVCFNHDGTVPRCATSTDLSGNSWSWSNAPYDRILSSIGGTPSLNKRTIMAATYGGGILTLSTNGGYILTSTNQAGTFDLPVVSSYGSPIVGKWVGEGTTLGAGDHLYGYANGNYAWWKHGVGMSYRTDLSVHPTWVGRTIRSLAYHNGYYYFGAADGLVARTPSLATPVFEFFQMPVSWQKVETTDMASFAGLVIASGTHGKLATA